MKGIFIPLLIVGGCSAVEAQSSTIKFYRDSLNKTTVDSNKAYCLYMLSYYYQNSSPDSALSLAQSAYSLSEKSKFLRGQIGALGQIASAFNRLGNFPKALEHYIEQLKLIEIQNDPYNIASAYLRIALVYNSQQDPERALHYAYKADSIGIAIIESEPTLHLYATLNLGEIYSTNNQLDSASFYTTLCYDESIRLKEKTENNTMLKPAEKINRLGEIFSCAGTALNNTGNIYFKEADYDKALTYYKNSIPYADSMQDFNTLAESYFGMAQSFEKKNMPDSALYYGKRSFNLASDNKFLKHSVNTSLFLAKLYKKQNDLYNAYAFQDTFIMLRDSFENAEKIKQLQRLTIDEQLRQRKKKEDEALQAKDRRLKLELLLVGMFIPILFFITAFISGKRVNKKIIKFSGIFSLLFLFEYITIFLHPWVVEQTGHSPIFEIFIFVAIAAIISPTHHRIEAWLINRLNTRHQRRINKALAAKAAAAAKAIEKENAAAQAKAIAAAEIASEDQSKNQSTKT
jgi:tetratricopeptide (TPR) repeat protein